MAYDPGALNAALAAAVGDDGDLMAELKAAFTESAARQLDLLGRSRCDANWEIAAARLKSIAASFGVARDLIALADEALRGRPGRSRRPQERSPPPSTISAPPSSPSRLEKIGTVPIFRAPDPPRAEHR